MNTHESYVSLKTAKMLEKAGFDWFCISAYYDGKLITNPIATIIYKEEVYAPSLAVAQRWLREVMKIEVFVEPFVGFYKYAVEELKEDGVYSDGREKSYEEAQEAGIKKALEVILEKGE